MNDIPDHDHEIEKRAHPENFEPEVFETGVEEINELNKKLASEGKDVFDQYAEPVCKHGSDISDCMICD